MSENIAWEFNNNNLILNIKVQPKASKQEILDVQSGYLRIRIKALPEDGAANIELIGLLAKTFGVTKKDVQLLSGKQSRYKRICIQSPNNIPNFIQDANNNS